MRRPNRESLDMIEKVNELHDAPTRRWICPECRYEEMRRDVEQNSTEGDEQP